MVLYKEDVPTKPACDKPPQVGEVVPIDVPADTRSKLRKMKPMSFSLKIDASGRVVNSRCLTPKDPLRLATPIQSALRQWRFEPIRSNGSPRAVELPLTCVAERIPRPGAGASHDIAPPRLVYDVIPRHPKRLLRKVTVPGGSPDVPVVIPPNTRAFPMQRVLAPGPNGQFRIGSQSFVVPRPSYYWARPMPGRSSNRPWFPASISVISIVDSSGVPRAVAIDAADFPLLEPEAAIAALSRRFQPAESDGRSIESRVRAEIFFPAPSIEGKSPEFLRAVQNTKSAESWHEAPSFACLALPIYPTTLVRAKIEGTASVELTLTQDGNLVDVVILKATREEFGQALLAAVRSCSFVPAHTHREPIASRCILEARFTLRPESMRWTDTQLPAFALEHNRDDSPISGARLDRAPRRIVGRTPRWPATQRPSTSNTPVTLELVVDASGRVREPEVIEAVCAEAGYAAVQAVATWLFEPPMFEGRPVAARFRVNVRFAEAAAQSQDHNVL